jgi:hypothetical protein
MPAVGDEGLHGLERAGEDVFEIHLLATQGDLAESHTRQIQQVVHHAYQVLHLPLHHLAGLERLLARRGQIQHFQPGANRRQRIAQLVRECRHELVLAPVVLAQLIVEPCILQRYGGHLRQLHQQRFVHCTEVARLLAAQLHQPHLPTGVFDQRHDQSVGARSSMCKRA